MSGTLYFTDARLRDEIAKCQYCEEKPCKTACPADCSPADFIMAVAAGQPSDYLRAAEEILRANPLGEVCGLVCPDSHCVRACVQKTHGNAIDIPRIQATIVRKARELKAIKPPSREQDKSPRIAVVGAGPAGLAASAVLSQKGYSVCLFDSAQELGGTCQWIPEFRLPRQALKDDTAFLGSLGIQCELGKSVDDPSALLKNGFSAVVVSPGLADPIPLKVPGEELTVSFDRFLKNPKDHMPAGLVAIVGGGAVATDCALVAKLYGARRIEMFVLERLEEMPLDKGEMESLIAGGIDVNPRTRITAIKDTGESDGQFTLETTKVRLRKPPLGFSLDNLEDEPKSCQLRKGYGLIVTAIGARRRPFAGASPGIFFAGDYDQGPSTVVEAVASGKNAASHVDEFLRRVALKTLASKPRKSHVVIGGFNPLPVNIRTDFFGREIMSPFLLAAAPPSDGYDQMKKAYQAGWAGGVMKTSFDGVPIHIPGEYMFVFGPSTYANCDNVSGHSLDRVCREVEALVKEFPDRLTLASTGGPVTGNDDSDRSAWQKNTAKLESSGAMGIEYSLSCPQGGDGTKGDIVSQDPDLTAKIIGWVLEAGNPGIPKLFKLTPAVTSVAPIMLAIKSVFSRYPGAKAGVTLANTFPTLAFRPKSKQKWDEGIIVGMSGSGVMPISCLTLARAARFGLAISGNGGAMSYSDAVRFLTLGAKTVQFCSLVLKHGYPIINDLHSGLSHYLADRELGSVAALIGIALPNPIADFMELPPTKKISDRTEELCASCGNCTRCPYLAISLDDDGHPKTDASRCIGCSLCAQKCFTGALFMRKRTSRESSLLRED